MPFLGVGPTAKDGEAGARVLQFCECHRVSETSLGGSELTGLLYSLLDPEGPEIV